MMPKNSGGFRRSRFDKSATQLWFNGGVKALRLDSQSIDWETALFRLTPVHRGQERALEYKERGAALMATPFVYRVRGLEAPGQPGY